MGHAGIRHADPRWYAATLINYVLGGSDFSSRLMTEVRVKRGLTYGIGSSFGTSLYQGAFRVSAATKNQSVWDALLASVDEIRRMQAEGPTPAELDKAKGYYAGSYPFSLQTAAGIASKGGIRQLNDGSPNRWLDPRIRPLSLTRQEKTDLVEFLGALSGEGWQHAQEPEQFP